MQNPNRRSSSPSPQIARSILTRLLGYFSHLLYHQLAWTYDWVAGLVSVGEWQQWVASVIPFLENQRTLEIGFGPGHLQAALAKKGIMVFGLDKSKQMGRIARRRLSKLDVNPRLILGDALFLPFIDQSFSQVVMTFPSEYILKPETFNDIYRVLTQCGSAFILPVAWITGRNPLQRFAARVNSVTDEGQLWSEQYILQYTNRGFTTERKIIDLGDSKVLIIKMKKTTITMDR